MESDTCSFGQVQQQRAAALLGERFDERLGLWSVKHCAAVRGLVSDPMLVWT